MGRGRTDVVACELGSVPNVDECSMYLCACMALYTYYKLIFVVDSNDRDRVSLARAELHRIAADENLDRAPILVWANKQDVRGSMSASELSDALNLSSFRDRTWQIFGCSALTGKGITSGLDWLATTLSDSKA